LRFAGLTDFASSTISLRRKRFAAVSTGRRAWPGR
jgi:hypothetical protein